MVQKKMKNVKGTEITCSELSANDVIVLDDGNEARIIGVDKIAHTITNVVDLNVVKYEVIDGPSKGSLAARPLFNTDPVILVETPQQRRSRRWSNLKALFRIE